MLAEVIQAAAERGLGRVHREPNQPRNSPSRSARRAGHEGGHRNGSGRSGGIGVLLLKQLGNVETEIRAVRTELGDVRTELGRRSRRRP